MRSGPGLLLFGAGRGDLITRGTARAPLTPSRTQAPGVEATGFDGAGWLLYGANMPRFVGAQRRLLSEGERTNLVGDPRAGSTFGQAAPNQIAANSIEIPRMIPSVAVTRHTRDTATADANVGQVGFTSAVGQPLSTPIVQTIYVWLPSSVNYGGSPSLELAWDVAVPGDVSVAANFSVRDQWQRISRRLSERSIDNNPGFVIRANIPNGAHFYSTAPQREYATFPSTPILPPIGAPAASTRGTDVLTALLSELGISDNGACTVLWRGAFSATNIGDTQTIIGIDGGTDTSRYDLRLGTTGIPNITRLVGGAPTASAFGSTAVTPGATIRAGMTINGAGRVAAVYDGFAGGAVQAITGGATTDLTTFRQGSSTFGNRPLWGETHTLIVLPRVLSDAELQAAVAAL
jgi:hypothetical protein